MELIRPGTVIDFVSRMNKAAILSVVVIAVMLISIAAHKGLNWGIEFVGGTEVHVKYAKRVRTEDVRAVLEASGYPAESIQQLGLAGDNEYLHRFSSEIVGFERINEFQEELKTLFETNEVFSGASILSIDYIGPKVGRELIKKAILAILLGWIGIMLYLMLRFEAGFAFGAVVAIIHDIIITVGAISLADKEFTLGIIAALLTVIGYSVNDTIVIFDRIRENLRKGEDRSFTDLVNTSINQTLSRTVLTVFTVLLVLGSLFLLGGSVIHDFAFTLIVGVTAGTYSSIFTASAFVIWWRGRKRKSSRAAASA